MRRPYASGANMRHVIEPAPTAAVRAMRLDTNLELMVGRSRRHSGERVLATIVATAGSTYRRAGARMLLMADGNYLGLSLDAHWKAKVPNWDFRGPYHIDLLGAWFSADSFVFALKNSQKSMLQI